LGYDDNVKNRSYFKEGDIKTARIIKPKGLAFDQNGELVFSDSWIDRILKIYKGRVTIIAGGEGKSAEGANFMGGGGGGGHVDGIGKQSSFESPQGIAFDKNGNLFIVDVSANSCIRKLSPDGVVTTFCKQSYNPLTKQYEEGFQNENSSADAKAGKKETRAPHSAIEKQVDSLLNDPKLKKLIRDAQALNIDSIRRAVLSMAKMAGPDLKDTTAFALPGKNTKALSKIPKEILSLADLQSYATNLYKKLAPAFHSAYGTPLVNTDAYDANTVSNAAAFATEAGHVDQAVLLSLKTIEKILMAQWLLQQCRRYS
jgi:hypothetical protein